MCDLTVKGSHICADAWSGSLNLYLELKHGVLILWHCRRRCCCCCCCSCFAALDIGVPSWGFLFFSASKCYSRWFCCFKSHLRSLFRVGCSPLDVPCAYQLWVCAFLLKSVLETAPLCLIPAGFIITLRSLGTRIFTHRDNWRHWANGTGSTSSCEPVSQLTWNHEMILSSNTVGMPCLHESDTGPTWCSVDMVLMTSILSLEPKRWLGAEVAYALAFENVHARQLCILFLTCEHNQFLCMDSFFCSQILPSPITIFTNLTLPMLSLQKFGPQEWISRILTVGWVVATQIFFPTNLSTFLEGHP